jgi:hypothetical protein
MSERIIGKREFTDGTRRTVYEDERGLPLGPSERSRCDPWACQRPAAAVMPRPKRWPASPKNQDYGGLRKTNGQTTENTDFPRKSSQAYNCPCK